MLRLQQADSAKGVIDATRDTIVRIMLHIKSHGAANILPAAFMQLDMDRLTTLSAAMCTSSGSHEFRTMAVARAVFAEALNMITASEKELVHARATIKAMTHLLVLRTYHTPSGISWESLNKDLMKATRHLGSREAAAFSAGAGTSSAAAAAASSGLGP
jgi:hypothetical protein